MKKVLLLFSALLAFLFANAQASNVMFTHVSDSLTDAIPYYIGVSSTRLLVEQQQGRAIITMVKPAR